MEITVNNIKDVNIKKLALDKERFGSLSFDRSLPFLERLKKFFVELDKLGYETELTEGEKTQVDQWKVIFTEYLQRLEQFDLNLPNTSPKDVHDNFENEVIGFYNSNFPSLRNFLTYLRQESILKNKDQNSLQKEREVIASTRKELEESLRQLQKDLKQQKARKKEIEEKKGSIASIQLAMHFAKQSNDYSIEAKNWLENRGKFFFWLLILIVINYSIYIIVFVFNSLGKITFGTDFIFSLEYGIINLSLLSLLFYSLRFSSQNYNIFSNLEAVTRHRKNVAQTLDDFLGTNPSPEVKDEMIKQGTEAMFKHLPTGYIPKSESKQSDPIIEAVTNFITKKDSFT